MSTEHLNRRHGQILRHMLGMTSKRRQDWGKRNYFATYATGDDYPALCEMERAGLVETTRPGSATENHYFRATTAGIAAVGMRQAHNGYLIPLEPQ